MKEDLFRRHESPGYLINMTGKSINHLLHHNFKKAHHDVSTEQWIILDELWRKDGLSQLELATATMRDQPSTSRIINTLTKRGLVYRAQDPLDKRKNLIFLTDKGKELQEALIGVVKQTIAESVKGIDPKDLDTCMEVLRLIRANTRSNR